jgi:hypothetical protein
LPGKCRAFWPFTTSFFGMAKIREF